MRELGPAQIAEYEPRGARARRDPRRHDRHLRLRRGRRAAGRGCAGAGATIRYGARGRARSTGGPARGRRAHGAPGTVRPGAGAGQLRRAALRPRWPGWRATTRGCGSCRSAASTTSWRRPAAGARPGLPGARPGVPVPRRPSDPRHRRRRPRRARTRCPALAREGYGWRTVRPRELAGDAGLAGLLADSPPALAVRGGRAAPLAVEARRSPTAVRRLLPAVTRGRPGARRRPGSAPRRCCGTARWWTTS